MRTWQAGAAASLFPWYQEGVNQRAGWASQGERAGESRAGAWVHVLQATRASRCHAGLSPASGETVQGLQRPREDASLPPAPPPFSMAVLRWDPQPHTRPAWHSVCSSTRAH